MAKSRVVMIILLAVWYILFPLMLVDTASAICLLLLINPILSIISGLIYGKLQGFDWLRSCLFLLSISIWTVNGTA